jgi:hypothetical protein
MLQPLEAPNFKIVQPIFLMKNHTTKLMGAPTTAAISPS